jgi:hypothetical protein
VKRAGKILLAVGISMTTAVIAIVAWRRIEDSRRLSQPAHVQTDGGTNYIMQLLESTVGKLDAGYVLLLYLRFENPNAFPVTLQRNWFVLVGHNHTYYQPTTTGTQTPLIELPPNGVLEREMLSFTLSETALAGSIGLQMGRNDWVIVKDEKPFTERINRDEFRTFRRRRW